jgi:protein gp37
VNKTKIEWTDYVWNPVRGCLYNCPYCYGKRIDRTDDGMPWIERKVEYEKN